MSALWQTRFFTTVNNFCNLPLTQEPEIAFIGRSNVGKSTIINILCNQKKLAFTSKMPGCTRYINYYSINTVNILQNSNNKTKKNKICALLVDLPGYGYANISKISKLHWQKLLINYICLRQQLTGLIMIVDARRPFTHLDIQMLKCCKLTNKSLHCILNKADQLNHIEAQNALRKTYIFLSDYIHKYNQSFQFSAQLFSAIKRIGITEANNQIIKLLKLSK